MTHILRLGRNMAELELSVLARQCLDRRIPDRETLEREVAAWEELLPGLLLSK